MANNKWQEKLIPAVMKDMAACWACPIGLNTERGMNLAGQKAVREVVDDIVSILFPGCHGYQAMAEKGLKGGIQKTLRHVATALKAQVRQALQYQCSIDHGPKCRKCGDCERKAVAAVGVLLKSLPSVQATLQEDITAAYEGDPAAKSNMEVVMSYPGVYAIMVHRVAHVLYRERVPLIPRIMSEYAHSRTGIDIHPGAQIGPGFFIDHGTGVVIGETCVIGTRVKIYQGVTLGALSFEKDAQGRLIKDIKRHPNVEDHVVIYAGATILGGKTTIGAHSEVGGNVWLIHSVPPHSKVYNQQPRPFIRQADASGTTLNPSGDDLGSGI